MANYKNSLGESELFGRMTAGFAKVCESVQSGRFVRNEMGVICESVCEDEDERDSMFGDDDVFIGRNDEYYNEDPDDERVFTPAYWTYSMEGADDECFAKEGPVFKLTDEGKRDFEEWWDAEQVGYDLCYGRMKDEKFGKKHLSREQEWEYLTDPKNGLSVEVTGKVEEDEDAAEGAAPEGETADAGATATDAGTEGATQDDADVASATPEQINGSVTECGNAEKKPLKKLIPEGCCGGKARKVLKEEVQKLCKTCGNPLDETGTCQDCQGYSEVKEGEGEIKLQVPAELKRRADLKANAKANQEKVAKAIRDGKADGIVSEDENSYVVKKGGFGYYVKDMSKDKAVSPSFDTKEEAEQYLKDKFTAKEKGSVELTKDDVFGMLVNLLEQIRDGVSVEDVTANPDMEEFDDYSLDEVLELAGKYL